MDPLAALLGTLTMVSKLALPSLLAKIPPVVWEICYKGKP